MAQIPSHSREIYRGSEENRPELNPPKNMVSSNQVKGEWKNSDPSNLSKRQDVLQELSSNLPSETLLSGNEKSFGKETQTRPDPTKYGGIIINPEDALPSRQAELQKSTDNNRAEPYHYAMLQPKEGFIEREFNYEFERSSEPENVKIGGIIIDSNDMQPSMRDQYREGTNMVQLHEKFETSEGQTSSQSNLFPVVPSRSFYYEHQVPDRREDVVKTGGIIIQPEDALPYKQNEIHIDPRSGLGYAMLKPWKQVKEEQGGNLHSFINPKPRTLDEKIMTSSGPFTRNIIDASRTREMEPESRNEIISSRVEQPSQMESRQFSYEFTMPSRDEEIIKTGGIVIAVDDMLTSKQAEFSSQYPVAYVMLKSWNTIKEEQEGMIHNPNSQQEEKEKTRKLRKEYRNDTWKMNVTREEERVTGATQGTQEQPKFFEREFNMEYIMDREIEPVKYDETEKGGVYSERYVLGELPTRSTLNDLDINQESAQGATSLNYVPSSSF